MIKIHYSPKFKKQYQKLPLKIKKTLKEKGRTFSQNPFHPKLKTHKLFGKLRGLWSFSVNYKYRVLFEFKGEKIVRFHSIGDHSIYQ